MTSQNRDSGQDRPAGDDERMKHVIDKAKDMSAADLSGHEAEAREEGGRIERAVDAMSLGNTPRSGDDPQHLTGNTGRTPLPDATGGAGAKRGKA
ncbi:hypothetical protein [Azospirillum picis]|uniref:Uncharacterized protein n=1 Tax=Azospirillum picis TaxID=488438 RepID=A0ABU0MD97_9PROT|nr:hypothetical protein [Azospirillum picis]MBP2297595.1 hypothetical protein [Azospirillum picis]MDQ0531382.1 hypothetical protein [Azospirillum picis]